MKAFLVAIGLILILGLAGAQFGSKIFNGDSDLGRLVVDIPFPWAIMYWDCGQNSGVYDSGDTGSYLGLTSGSKESSSGQLGLALDKTLVFGRLGMASVSSTSISEQVDLAAGSAFGAEIYTPEQTPTTPTSSSVSHPVLKDHDPVLRHRVSDKNFLAPSLRPTLLLGSIFQPTTIIIP